MPAWRAPTRTWPAVPNYHLWIAGMAVYVSLLVADDDHCSPVPVQSHLLCHATFPFMSADSTAFLEPHQGASTVSLVTQGP